MTRNRIRMKTVALLLLLLAVPLGLAALGLLLDPAAGSREPRPGAPACCLLGGPGLPVAAAATPLAGADEDPAAEDAKKEEGKEKNPAVGGALDADPTATGAIKGTVLFKGERIEGKPHEVPKDHKDIKVCSASVPYETHIIGPENELANVVVSLEGAALPAGKPREIELNNRHCQFVPHVQATTVRSQLVIGSDDPILHSALALGAASFNVAIPSTSTKITKRLPREGWVIFKCSTHSWMSAHVQVFKHDFFAVTGKDGAFELKGIPPGEYSVQFWHEGLEGTKRTIKVEAGKTSEANVELEPYK